MRVVQAEGATYGLTSNVGAELGLGAEPGPKYALCPAVDVVHVVGEGLSKAHDRHVGAILVQDALLVRLVELVQGSLVRLHKKKRLQRLHTITARVAAGKTLALQPILSTRPLKCL